MTFSTTLLLPLIKVTFSGLLDKFHSQGNLQIFHEKLKKEPNLQGYFIKIYTKDSLMGQVPVYF